MQCYEAESLERKGAECNGGGGGGAGETEQVEVRGKIKSSAFQVSNCCQLQLQAFVESN